MPSFRSRLSSVIVGSIFVVFGVGIWTAYQIRESIHNAYAQWWVADMVVAHLKANNDNWPRTWDDLRDDYQTCVKRSGQPWSFEELSDRVVVDWSVEARQLVARARGDAAVPFRVIWLFDGSSSHWQHAEPNQIVSDYLKSAK